MDIPPSAGDILLSSQAETICGWCLRFLAVNAGGRGLLPPTAITTAFVTGHAQHIELADEIAEDDCAVAGTLVAQSVI